MANEIKNKVKYVFRIAFIKTKNPKYELNSKSPRKLNQSESERSVYECWGRSVEHIMDLNRNCIYIRTCI